MWVRPLKLFRFFGWGAALGLIALFVLAAGNGGPIGPAQGENPCPPRQPNGWCTLSRSAADVYSVAFSPDGKLLASGSYDSTIKLWEVATGREVRTLSGHADVVNTVAFSPDGKLLASGHDDKTIGLWKVETGEEMDTFTAHGDSVNSVAFSPDGRYLASGSGDATTKLWEVASGTELRTLDGHVDSVYSVVFSPDGKLLASASRDGSIKLWYVGDLTAQNQQGQQDQTTQAVKTLTGHDDTVRSVVFTPDGKQLISGSADKTIKLWSLGDLTGR